MKVKTWDLINLSYSLEVNSVPLRVWSIEWPLPEKIKFEGYIINLNTSHETNVNINRHALWGEVEKVNDFKKRVYGDKNPKQWGKGNKSGRRFDYKEIEGDIWIKILSKSNLFNIENRKFSFDGKYLRMSLFQGEIAPWYLSGEGQVRFIILPKFINLDEEFFELIGFLDGEMCTKKSSSGGASVKISNSEPVIIKNILSRFNKSFQIPIESWTASITVNNKNSSFNEEDNIKIKNFWSQETNIPVDEFTKTTIQNKYNSLFSKNGIIQIRYSDTLFFSILLQIMKNTRDIIIKNKGYCAAYLRGVAAGEGGIGKTSENKLRMVHIGSTNEENKTFYSQCLKKIGITSIQRYKLRIETCGLTNFLILNSIDIFKYIPYRKENFLITLANLQRNYKKRKLALNNN
ncbi:MAG: LAGLIDADG family homing endonuclease [Candidatus Pacearchaeota archaeon]|nr:LAGLIDADG family homing endonuclease [Candidatus Pacearchaeota archaeon]